MVPVSGVSFSASSVPPKISGGEAWVGCGAERGAADATNLESVD